MSSWTSGRGRGRGRSAIANHYVTIILDDKTTVKAVAMIAVNSGAILGKNNIKELVLEVENLLKEGSSNIDMFVKKISIS